MINSAQRGTQLIDKVSRYGYRPSLLVHSCCGPCSAYPLQLLNQYFDITVYFNNSNIYPESEFNKRYDELVRYISILNKDSKNQIKIIRTPYAGEEYQKMLESVNDNKEGGIRCKTCFRYRLNEAYRYASDNHFTFFTTVMTSSRQKDEQVINEIGLDLQKIYPNTTFIVHNFKKKGGQELGLALTKKYDLYQQLFCGCKFSLR